MDHFLVMPAYDPKGNILPRLERILPTLKEFFSGAVVSADLNQRASPLQDPFFHLTPRANGQPVGAQFHALYQQAAALCPPGAALHLCFPDRLAFQVESEHRAAFFASLRALQPGSLPRLYQRSAAAWASHPTNYYEIESAISMVGKWTCGRWLDFAWCHLALKAQTLRDFLPRVRRSDLSMMAEMVWELRDSIQTEDVDWLAWEDPFILGRPAQELKRTYEQSPEETRKRLSYALPMMDVIYEAVLPFGRGEARVR